MNEARIRFLTASFLIRNLLYTYIIAVLELHIFLCRTAHFIYIEGRISRIKRQINPDNAAKAYAMPLYAPIHACAHLAEIC